MRQSYMIGKVVFLILALMFASSAKASDEASLNVTVTHVDVSIK